jgi:putative transposase
MPNQNQHKCSIYGLYYKSMIIRKAFKYRLYPSAQQEAKLAVQFGHARFVYNHFLGVRKEYYQAHQNDHGKKGLNYFDTNKMLTEIKRNPEYQWLKEADSQALQESLRHLDRAYQNFFAKRSEYPRFKKKSHDQSVHYPQRFWASGSKVFAPKVGEIKAVIHRPQEGTPKNMTVSRTRSGKYYASIQCELEVPGPQPKNGEVGIDLGLDHFAVLSNGEVIDNPRYLVKSEKKLKRLHRQLSRKVKGSNGRSQARFQLARQYEKVADQRKDFLHKTTRRLINTYGFLAIEDLNVAGMVKNHHLAKHISDAGWGEFARQLIYKGSWYGSQVDQVERFFPSSKKCHICGFINRSLQLSDREWDCPECGTHHDRDGNASINILDHSRAGSTRSYAGGEGVKPAIRRQSSTKPEAQALRLR